MSITSRGARLAPAAVALLALAACGGGDQPKVETPTTSTSSPSPSVVTPSPTATPSVPPDAQDAVAAYQAFNAAVRTSQQKPPATTTDPPTKGGDYTLYSFDPERTRTRGGIIILSQKKRAWRGTPPEPTISVIATDLEAKPYPVVTLKVCFTPSPSWQEYDVKTGKPLVTPKPSGRPIQADVIYYQKRWGVAKTAAGEGTCG